MRVQDKSRERNDCRFRDYPRPRDTDETKPGQFYAEWTKCHSARSQQGGLQIDSAKVLPIESGQVTISLIHGGEGATKVTVDYDYTTKWGAVGRLLDSRIANQLSTGFEGFLDDLAAAAETAAADTTTAGGPQ